MVSLKERLKTDYEQIQTHTYKNREKIFLGNYKNDFYVLDRIIMDTFESQNNRHQEELAAKASRLKHVCY